MREAGLKARSKGTRQSIHEAKFFNKYFTPAAIGLQNGV